MRVVQSQGRMTSCLTTRVSGSVALIGLMAPHTTIKVHLVMHALYACPQTRMSYPGET